MGKREFWGCMDCKTAIPISETNQAPKFPPDYLEDGEPEPQDEMFDFLRKHLHHHVERLFVSDGPFSHQRFAESLREDFFSVQTEAGEELILRRWRTAVAEPIQYEIRSGKIVIAVKQINFQEKELADMIRRIFPQNPPSEEDVEALVGGARLLKEHHEEHIKKHFLSRFHALEEKDLIAQTEYPLRFLVAMDECFFEYLSAMVLMLYCSRKQETIIENILQRENNPYGAMALEIEIDFQVL